MFKPHTDTEKVPGMFGTVVVCLPSAHTSNHLVFRHNSNTKLLKSGDHQPSYAAWYADVSREFRIVEAGHGLVLTYNLAKQRHTGPANLLRLVPDYADLVEVYRVWQDCVDDPLIYMLEHKYTEASFNVQALKGGDRDRVEALRKLAKAHGLDLYLGAIEKSVIGEAEDDGEYNSYGRSYGTSLHSIGDVLNQQLQLTRVIDDEGVVIDTDIDIEEGELLRDDPSDRDPDEEDYTGYTGTAGGEATHWYRDSVRSTFE